MTEPTRYCTHCGYALEGVTSPQCPECGKPWEHRFDFTYSAESLEKRRHSDLRRRVSYLLIVATVYCLPGFVVFPLIGLKFGCWTLFVYGLWIAVIVWCARSILDTSRITSAFLWIAIGAAIGVIIALPDGGLAT